MLLVSFQGSAKGTESNFNTFHGFMVQTVLEPATFHIDVRRRVNIIPFKPTRLALICTPGTIFTRVVEHTVCGFTCHQIATSFNKLVLIHMTPQLPNLHLASLFNTKLK